MILSRTGSEAKELGRSKDGAESNCFGLDHFDFGAENRIERPQTAKNFLYFLFPLPVISRWKISVIFLNDLFGQHYTSSRLFSSLL